MKKTDKKTTLKNQGIKKPTREDFLVYKGVKNKCDTKAMYF